MTTNQSPAELARIMHDAYFDDTAAAITTYLNSTPNDDPTRELRDRIELALDFDIADLIHNGNLNDLLPFAADLNDDDYDILADRILDDSTIIAELASLILLDIAAEL